MLAVRRWSIRHAGWLERCYAVMRPLLRAARPLARLLGPRRLRRPLAAVESAVKGFLFDCRMCGRCALSASGMSCPMNCPKQVRNGPCGGVRADGGCELQPDMPCVWAEGWAGSRMMRAGALPTAPVPPADHSQQGESSWLRVITTDDAPGQAPPQAVGPTDSRLAALLSQDTFVVTAELSPPDSADPAAVAARAAVFRGHVDALNVTDGAGAHCHLSSLATCVLLQRLGCEAIMQLTCRDRNRIAAQGDILGAAALGVTNLLCLTGDGVEHGDHPGAKPVFDLDAVTLLETARTLTAGRFLSGRMLTGAPRLFLGGADNPFAPPVPARVGRLAKKVAAGARFVQTQYCFDVDAFAQYMQAVRARGLHERCAMLVGVGPLTSLRAAQWLRARVPGVHVPDAVMSRLASAHDVEEEGVRLCVEIIQRLREVPGVAGVHLMAHRHERLVGEIVTRAGLFAGRAPLFREEEPRHG